MPASPRPFHPRASLALAVAFTALQLFQLLLLPAWLLPLDGAWGWLLLLPVLLSNGWWAFIHEAIHGTLSPDRDINRTMGRMQGILFGAGFDLLRWGHLLHHAMNRTRRDRSEVYEEGRRNRAAFTLEYYGRLLGGLYYFEVLWSLLLLAPRPWLLKLTARLAGPDNPIGPMADKLLSPATLAAVRRDALAILALYGTAFYLYGDHAWMLALAIAARALLISLMDNVFHYGTPLDDRLHAYDLALPRWASAIILNFNLHGTHHLHPGLSCWDLPAAHRARGGGYHGPLVPTLMAQFRGPIPASRLAAANAA
jgi:fatty acid desaturase